MNLVQKAKDNIDPTIMFSTLAASAVIGITVYGLRQAGMSGAAKIVRGG